MTMLEKIIYIADYIEPNRKIIPGLQEIRRLVFQDIDRAVYLSAQPASPLIQPERRRKSSGSHDRQHM